MVKAPKGIIPYKKMQTTVKKAGMFRPTREAQSREDKPLHSATVILKITENHEWLKDFELSDGSDNDYRPRAVKDQPPSIPYTSPVLKVTGRPEGGLLPAVDKDTQADTSHRTLRGESIPDD